MKYQSLYKLTSAFSVLSTSFIIDQTSGFHKVYARAKTIALCKRGPGIYFYSLRLSKFQRAMSSYIIFLFIHGSLRFKSLFASYT